MRFFRSCFAGEVALSFAGIWLSLASLAAAACLVRAILSAEGGRFSLVLERDEERKLCWLLALPKPQEYQYWNI
jgi:hypothetical protein